LDVDGRDEHNGGSLADSGQLRQRRDVPDLVQGQLSLLLLNRCVEACRQDAVLGVSSTSGAFRPFDSKKLIAQPQPPLNASLAIGWND
jgi:hypothetical protein